MKRNPKQFAEDLRRWREENKYSLREAAKIIGVGHTTFTNWENGTRPTAKRKELFNATGIDYFAYEWNWKEKKPVKAKKIRGFQGCEEDCLSCPYPDCQHPQPSHPYAKANQNHAY